MDQTSNNGGGPHTFQDFLEYATQAYESGGALLRNIRDLCYQIGDKRGTFMLIARDLYAQESILDAQQQILEYLSSDEDRSHVYLNRHTNMCKLVFITSPEVLIQLRLHDMVYKFAIFENWLANGKPSVQML